MPATPWQVVIVPPLLGKNGPVQAWGPVGSNSAPSITRTTAMLKTVTLDVSDTASQAGGSAGDGHLFNFILTLALMSFSELQWTDKNKDEKFKNEKYTV